MKKWIRKIKKALREYDLVGIVRCMHFGQAFYVVPEESVCRTPIHPRPTAGEITRSIYEEWYDMVPDESAGVVEIYRQPHYGEMPWLAILRHLKERRLAS